MLDGTADAAAVFDSDLKLALCNERFAAASMIPEEALAEGLSLDEAVRQQCLAGAFGDVDDVESETMRRAQIIGLGTDDASGLTQVGPGGARIPVLSRRMPDSGVVVFLGGLSRWTPPPRVAPKPEPAPMPEPVAEAAPQRIEW